MTDTMVFCGAMTHAQFTATILTDTLDAFHRNLNKNPFRIDRGNL